MFEPVNPYSAAFAYFDMGLWWRLVLRNLIVAWCFTVMVAALYTGAAAGGYFKTSMTGFLPPHYGYSAYAIVPLLFLAPWQRVRWVAGAALLASGNRASWLGALAGALWRRPVLAAVLGALAAFGGLYMKPAVVRNRTDNVRVQIWTTAWGVALEHPRGIGRGNFIRAIAGREVNKAHSDVLQLLVEGGFLLTGLVLALLGVGLYALAPGPEKDVVVALTVQSVIDNRLHHPACATLYALAWLAAVLDARSRPSTTQ